MKIVLRGHEPRWLAPVAVLGAVLVTIALTAIPIRLAGANPPAAFERYLVTPLSSVSGLYEVLLTATPLLFTGIAVANTRTESAMARVTMNTMDVSRRVWIPNRCSRSSYAVTRLP